MQHHCIWVLHSLGCANDNGVERLFEIELILSKVNQVCKATIK